MGWTLADIRQKVRRVTGRLSQGELSNDEVDTYINNFYQFTFPADAKLDRKYTYYEFLTTPNRQTYPFPDTSYLFVQPPAYMDNLELFYYQDPGTFEDQNPQSVQRVIPWTGDGATTVFSTTVTGFPILPNSLVATDNIETFEDTNTTYTTSNVNITGSAGGAAIINYSTGSVSITFSTAPEDGQDIYLSYILFNAGRPTAVLYYNNQFKFFTVPDTAYRFKIQAYQYVSALSGSTSTPDLEQWGPCIAYGAARDIHSDYGEPDAYQEVTVLYKEQLAYVLDRTLQNLLNTRAKPVF